MTLSKYELLLLINLISNEVKPGIYSDETNEDYVNILSKLTMEYGKRSIEGE